VPVPAHFDLLLECCCPVLSSAFGWMLPSERAVYDGLSVSDLIVVLMLRYSTTRGVRVVCVTP